MSRMTTSDWPHDDGYDEWGHCHDIPRGNGIFGIYWPYWRKWADRLGCDRAKAFRVLGGYETDSEREIAVSKWETEQGKVNKEMIKANPLKGK